MRKDGRGLLSAESRSKNNESCGETLVTSGSEFRFGRWGRSDIRPGKNLDAPKTGMVLFRESHDNVVHGCKRVNAIARAYEGLRVTIIHGSCIAGFNKQS